MSYIVMARKWRPQTFAEVVGQEHIVRTLQNAITANRISHAYLFTGPRGVGKTTTARLLAKAVNCLSPVAGEPCNHCVRCEEIVAGSSTDVLEIDAASSGLVDDARELREKVKYAPASCRYKVLIIDEVHMMSNAAFNALLKTLEEPPAHTIFILATTEVHKVPATIVSRCQRFDFRRIPEKEIVERLASMAQTEGIAVEEEALHTVARGADGSLRDAQSLLDQIISFSGERVTVADAVTILGLVPMEIFVALVDAVAGHDAPRALALIQQLINQGADLRQFMKDWVEYWRNLVVVRAVTRNREEVLSVAASAAAALERQAALFSLEELTLLAQAVARTDEELRRSQHPRMLLELLLVRLCGAQRIVSIEVLWRQLQDLEARLASLPDAPPTEPGSGAARGDAEALHIQLDEPAGGGATFPEGGEPAFIADALEETAPPTILEQARGKWAALLEGVGQKNRRIQALLKDTRLTAAESGWLELTCSSPYHLTGLEKEESKKVIEAVLQSVLGRPMRLRLKVAEEVSREEAPASPQAGKHEEEFAEIARKEPLVQKALELFGGKIVDVVSKPTGKH